ncbi:enoyl-CoA hydratase/isomerase family protein [Diaminobutyricimonas sp. TR449]|uniref:enoyl-CoA hydratase/isomerase family protein n=1 Tax=Diaminobutyricimonas sp. TR449 TaxID=2708076 RepID=UPI0014225902|nr:enoyl-CoA hydratase/isomerase family protein [Diaminobutyricimonas sp. TR449]
MIGQGENVSVRVERADRVVTVILSRGEKRNALSPDMADLIRSVVNEAQVDRACGCIVITSDSADFSAGADLALAQHDRRRGVLDRHVSAQPVFDLVATIASSTVPVVSAVSGNCLGGGVGIAAASALVVADPTTKFDLPEARLGIFPAALSPHLAARIGAQRAFSWGLLGGVVQAAEAHGWGLVDIVADDHASKTARAIAERLVDSNRARLVAAAMEWRTLARAQAGVDEGARTGRLLSMLYADPQDSPLESPLNLQER